MKPRVKKAAIVAVKIAILAGILEYARRQSQLVDEIGVPAADAPGAVVLARRDAVVGSGPGQKFVFTTVDGRTVEVAPQTRLRVVDQPEQAGRKPGAYRVEVPGGSRIEIAARDIQGSPGAAEGAPFALFPGLYSLFENLQFGLLGFAFLIFGPALFLMAVRLRILLTSSGIHIPFFTLVRLHYLGFFFNSFMPGGAGGDIIKAVYLARHCAQKAESATMVLIDRVVGLIGLLLMAGLVVLFDYRHMHGIALQVGSLALALTLGSLLFFSLTFRKIVRYDWIIAKLPRAELAKRMDAALFALRDHKVAVLGALGLTIFLQLLEVAGIGLAGQSLGLFEVRATHYLAFVPIGYLSNALPISFGGIGLMEGTFLKLFRDAGVATATQGFMLGVLARLIVLAWSLVGALSALFPPEHAQAEATSPHPVDTPTPEQT